MATINNQSPGNRPLKDGELLADITRPNRQMNDAAFKEIEARRVHEAEERARESTRRARPDRIEVSSEARLMLARSEAAQKSDEADRRQRALELRREYLEGKLATPERVEKAAESILGA